MTPRTISPDSLAKLLGNWRGPGGEGPAPRPAYRALADAVTLLALDGRVPLGTALPSERQLADTLAVSRTTVTAAYSALRADGFLQSHRGARSVLSTPSPHKAGPRPQIDIAWPGLGRDAVIDLNYAALPALEGVVAQAYHTALRQLPRHLPTVGFSPVGLPALRDAVAHHYRRRGLETTAEQVLVTNGAQHALTLLLGTLARPGERVVIEQPTYPHALDAVRRAGALPVAVPLGAGEGASGGWDVDAFELAVRQSAPRLGYLIVDHHNPTGQRLSAQGRAGLARVLNATRSVVVNDETLAGMWLDSPPPPPLAAYTEERGRQRGSVITIGSLSKSYWGGIRVGWIRADRATIEAVAQHRFAVDLGTPVVEQLAAAHLLTLDGDPVAPRREQLRRQRAALLEALAAHLPDWLATPGPGGLSLWAALPAPVSTALAAAARQHGVSVTAGPRFGAQGALERFLRLPYTQPPDVLEAAVVRLAAAYRSLTRPVPAPALDAVL